MPSVYRIIMSRQIGIRPTLEAVVWCSAREASITDS